MSVKLFGIDKSSSVWTSIEIKHKYLIFPGGEPHVEIPIDLTFYDYCKIDLRGGNTNDFMHLLALTNAIKNIGMVSAMELFKNAPSRLSFFTGVPFHASNTKAISSVLKRTTESFSAYFRRFLSRVLIGW